jgi:hypothetical protein
MQAALTPKQAHLQSEQLIKDVKITIGESTFKTAVYMRD